jgi:hypothetical protein
MKKLFAFLCVGVLAAGLTGCGSSSEGTGSSEAADSGESSSYEDVQESSAEDTVGTDDADAAASGAEDDYSEGWSDEMEEIKAAVVDLLGEDYIPDMALDAEMFAASFGVTEDMYDDYLAEMPMISANVDTLVIVKAKEGQEQAVEDALNAYRNVKINDTMQYPKDVGKIQASIVERIGSYVCFIQLGADTMDALDEGDEAVIAQCSAVNESVLEVLNQKIQ